MVGLRFGTGRCRLPWFPGREPTRGRKVVLVPLSRERTPFGRTPAQATQALQGFSQPGTDALRQELKRVERLLKRFSQPGTDALRQVPIEGDNLTLSFSQPGTDALRQGAKWHPRSWPGFSQPGTDALRQGGANILACQRVSVSRERTPFGRSTSQVSSPIPVSVSRERTPFGRN